MTESKITLHDIAGYEEQKEEAKKIINILKRYDEFKQAGAYIPKGLLLAGPCGTGKTMIAKAIANESNVPLFEFENSETADEEGTVKVIRELFARARNQAPSIIFIDEIDELVSNSNFFSDYSRKTTKVLLTEIDGINSSDGIMVIATTNHRSELPPALLRSGRMDKQIVVPMPDSHSRTKIAKLYLDKNPLFKDISPKEISSKTVDFSCADIKTLINETLIDCLSSSKTEIDMADFERIIPIIRFKDIKKTMRFVDDHVVAHEVGHFVVNYALTGTIGSLCAEQYGEIRGNHVTELFEDEEEEKDAESQLVSSLENQIAVFLAGNIAEKKKFNGDCTTGSRDDIAKAHWIANDILNSGKYGYEYYSPMEYRSRNCQIPSGLSQDGRSEREKKIKELFEIATSKAEWAINDNHALFDALCKELKEKQRLSRKEITKIIDSCNSVAKIETTQNAIYACKGGEKNE
ncbi:MAG: AAA family ATPase [Bacilli bacterium]|nr:AAA family ATPase [Bacilli bacterium]